MHKKSYKIIKKCKKCGIYVKKLDLVIDTIYNNYYNGLYGNNAMF